MVHSRKRQGRVSYVLTELYIQSAPVDVIGTKAVARKLRQVEEGSVVTSARGVTQLTEEHQEERLLMHSTEIESIRERWDEKPSLSIILPAHNEAETIRDVVMDYHNEIAARIPSRLIVAEDGSSDLTPEILASLASKIPILLYSERRRKGYAKGVRDALKKCGEDWVFFSDSDGQYSPSDFWKLWQNRREHDMIIGRKIRRNEGIHRIVLSKVFHALVNSLFGLSLHDGDCGFRLIKRELLLSVIDETNILKYSFWTEFTIRASLKGFRIREVPISHANRASGGTRIYAPSKIPLIVLKQIRGLAGLYSEIKMKRSNPTISSSHFPLIDLKIPSKYQAQTSETIERTVT